MTRPAKRLAIMTPDQVDQMIFQFSGIEGRIQYDELSIKPFPRLPILMAAQIIDGDVGGTDISAMHAEWVVEEQRGRGAGGRPPTISTRSMLVILLMHVIANEPVSIRHMTATLESRLSSEDMEIIDLDDVQVEGQGWYYRLNSAYRALLEPIDPEPMPKYPRNDPNRPSRAERLTRHRKLTGPQRLELKQFRESIASLRRQRMRRLNDISFALIANIVRQAQAVGLLDGYSGDIALDGTYVKVDGKASNMDLSQPARSTNLEAGAWGRQGNHFSQGPLAPGQVRTKGTKRFKFGFEADIVSMTAGTPSIPDLVLGVNLHRPGAIKHVAKTLFPRIATLELPVRVIAVDRAYNNLKTKSFHLRLLREGYEFVFDYKSTQLGIQASFHHNGVGYVMVEGTWYLGFIPDELANANKQAQLPASHPGHIDEETLKKRIEARRDYQLTRLGRRDKDGFQRYNLPDPSGYIAFDAATGELLDKPTIKTVTIPMSVGLKFQQKYPFKSAEWQAAYNLRSGIERKNGQLKHTKFESLGDALRRPTRGYTSHALNIAMLMVAHNLRTIDNFLRTAEGIDTKKSQRRRTRRADDEKLTRIRKQPDGRTAA